MTSPTVTTIRTVSDSIVSYLNEIGKEPLLTFSQEQELACQLRNGDAAARRLENVLDLEPAERQRLQAVVTAGQSARAQLINSNLRLVVSVARRYQNNGLSLLDLIQEGTLGLMRAVDKFDPDRGLKFSTYATYWIRQSVGRAVADHGRTVRLPVHLGERLGRLSRARQQLTQRFDRDPTYDEMARETGLTREQVVRAERAGLATYSLDEAHNDDGSGALGDTISDTFQPSPLDQVMHQLLRADVYDALSHLTARERCIMELRYGLDGNPPLTLEQIGNKLGLTRERVRQLEGDALQKLRNPLVGRRLHGYLEDV